MTYSSLADTGTVPKDNKKLLYSHGGISEPTIMTGTKHYLPTFIGQEVLKLGKWNENILLVGAILLIVGNHKAKEVYLCVVTNRLANNEIGVKVVVCDVPVFLQIFADATACSNNVFSLKSKNCASFSKRSKEWRFSRIQKRCRPHDARLS
jgi:hypothetical protein